MRDSIFMTTVSSASWISIERSRSLSGRTFIEHSSFDRIVSRIGIFLVFAMALVTDIVECCQYLGRAVAMLVEIDHDLEDHLVHDRFQMCVAPVPLCLADWCHLLFLP